MHDIYTKFGGLKQYVQPGAIGFRRVLCILKSLCTGKKDKKKKKIKKTKQKKEKLHLDKTNCSVYVFNVLCSACFSMEWNIPNVDLFSKWISVTRPPTHAALHTHTGMCTVRWNTEEIKTVRLLVDGLMKDEGSSFFSSSHLTHKSTHRVSPLLILFHITQTLTFTDPTELITLLCAVRGGGGRKVMAIKQAWNIQHDVVQVGVHSSHRSHSSIHYPPESLYRLRWTEKGG